MMTIVRVSLLLLIVAACGGDGKQQTGQTDGSVDDNESVDTAIDAKPPNITHLGTVQAARIGAGSSTTAIGFYDVPSGAPGCTWMYSGNCSLQTCAASSGLVAASAGPVTITVGATPMTSTPTGTTYPSVSLPPLDPGTTVTASAVGDTVPAFTSSALVTPSALTNIQPAAGATIPKSDPLMVTWSAVDSRYYVNISQQNISSPYPAGFALTLRCTGSSIDGSVTIAPSLLSSFDTSTQGTLYAGALADEDVVAGNYDVDVRVLIVDTPRKINFQ